jgi:hypothetical protein
MKALIGPVLSAFGGILFALWLAGPILMGLIRYWPSCPPVVALALILLVPAMLSGTLVAVGQAVLSRK